MRLSHLLIAGATAVSFSAFAAGEQKSQSEQQPQAQSGQSQSSQSSSQQASQSQDTIKQAQEKLSAAGHEVQADGIMGPKTQAALKEFQEKKGLQASGELDQQTLAALGVSEGGAGASTGSSAEKSGSGGASQGSSSQGSSSEGSSSQGASGSQQESSSGTASQGASGGSSEKSEKKY
jgi:peptidoglycan hydrolase-like protein with peptidoglycan-binding domain